METTACKLKHLAINTSIRMETELGNIKHLAECFLIKRLHIIKRHIKFQSFGVNLMMDQRIKNEGIIRAGRKAKCQFHN